MIRQCLSNKNKNKNTTISKSKKFWIILPLSLNICRLDIKKYYYLWYTIGITKKIFEKNIIIYGTQLVPLEIYLNLVF